MALTPVLLTALLAGAPGTGVAIVGMCDDDPELTSLAAELGQRLNERGERIVDAPATGTHAIRRCRPLQEETLRRELSQAEKLFYSFEHEAARKLLTELEHSLSEGRWTAIAREVTVEVTFMLGWLELEVNNPDQATLRFQRVRQLDTSFGPDPMRFPPKVISAFEASGAASPHSRSDAPAHDDIEALRGALGDLQIGAAVLILRTGTDTHGYVITADSLAEVPVSLDDRQRTLDAIVAALPARPWSRPPTAMRSTSVGGTRLTQQWWFWPTIGAVALGASVAVGLYARHSSDRVRIVVQP